MRKSPPKMSEEYEKAQKASIGVRLKFLLKDSVLYGGVSSVSKFLHIFLLPILARFLSKEEYGIYDTLLIVSSFAIIIIISGTDSSLARFFYEKKEKTLQKELVSQTLLFEIIASIVISFILWVFASKILYLYFDSSEYLNELRLLIFVLPFLAIVRFTQNLLKWLLMRKEFIIVSAGSIAFTMLLSIYFIVFVKSEIRYLFYSQLISMFLFSVLGLIFCRKYLMIPTSLNTIVPQLKFGLSLSANQLLTSFVPAIDRYFVSSFFGLEALGIYAVGNKISQLSQFVINGFQVAWGPLAYSIMKEKNAEQTYNKVFNYYIIFVSVFIIFFSVFIPFFVNVLASSKYLQAIKIIYILLLSKLLMSVSGVTSIGIGLSKKTKYHLFAAILKLCITTLLIFLFLNIFNLVGVALGVLAGVITHIIVVNYFAYKVSDIRFSFFKTSFIVIFSSLIGIVLLFNFNSLIKIAIALISVLLIFVFSWYLLFDEHDEAFFKKNLLKLFALLGIVK